jgi:phospholipase/lecithinase/hemolysin
MLITRRFLFVLAAVLFVLPGVAAQGQAYTSIVVFGDSLCDTGNDAALSKAKNTVNAQVPGPASDYTLGRFTDGTDTVPAEHNYSGIWLEQLASMMPNHPAVANSLAGGTNYAYGFATTDVGATVFTYGPGNALSFTVENMGQQVSDYLATNPTITPQTLFVVWGGANDLIAATTPAQIAAAAARDAALVQRLIAAGATDIIVPNLPPLGLVPRFNGSITTSAPATQAAQGFDQALAVALAGIPAANPGKTLHIFSLDIYTLFNTIVGPPVYRFTNVTASSQGNAAVNPDTYLFWDDLHPTTAGHNMIALAALTLIGTPVPTATVVISSNLNVNQNAAVTLTAVVTGKPGIPIGTVAFFDGTTLLGTSQLHGTTNSPTASITTSTLAVGSHSITATYQGLNGYLGSSSSPVAQVVTAPGVNATLSPSTLTVFHNDAGQVNVTLTPVGGFSGTATIACGTLTTNLTCFFSPSSFTFTGNNVAQTGTLLIGTATASRLTMPGKGTEIVAAFAMLPLLGFAAFRRRRIGMLALLAVLSFGAIIGVSGCSDGTRAPTGTYTVPVVVTANGATTTTSLTLIVK